MTSYANPMKDRVAIAAAATTGFQARNTDRSQASYVAEACKAVLDQCGLTPRDVDGLCGSLPLAPAVQSMLGIPEVTWFANPMIPFGNHVAAAASAVHSGLCDVVLAYHGAYRMAWNTASALKDPFRRSLTFGAGGTPSPESVTGAVGYTAWASRYLHEFGMPREHLGYVAINSRTNALNNPHAAMRAPLTMEDYVSARMIRWPLCLLDMDVPVDGADAFIITATERARDLPLPPVLVHAVVLGMIDKNEEDQSPSLRRHGQHVTISALRAKSDFWIDDVDVYLPYDGFSIIALNWFENAGWCEPGEASDFIQDHWVPNDDGTGRILIKGRVPVNPHGGSLSEGGTQGSGHLREAVHQLQGIAGGRQVPGAERALLNIGGFFFNAQGITLRRA
ncbi:MAG TPA: thiolase family protein [Acidimicrobiales bacterium]|nr:thiolase family protein [Acidimicrobiales bacterium]